MKRFILLTFGFLGWAFYEMSGGAGFEPASMRVARLNPEAEAPVPDTTPTTVAPTVVAEAPTDTFVDTDPPALNPAPKDSDTVTRVSLNLTTLRDVLDATPSIDAEIAPQPTSVNVVPRTDGVILSSADTPAIIPSLIAPSDSGASVMQAGLDSESAGSDLRYVSGNRVNVRGGPGTEFGVVGKLVQGDPVEILLDDGSGWVKMRPIDGGEEGWMADFLLTSN